MCGKWYKWSIDMVLQLVNTSGTLSEVRETVRCNIVWSKAYR